MRSSPSCFARAKIRATNSLFIFWDLFYPLGYLLVFGVGMNASLASRAGSAGVDYNAFFLAGVLGMASFGIASNTSWSFFLDRDNGIFYEMLTYPMSRSQYLLGKVLFNVAVALVQAVADGRARGVVARRAGALRSPAAARGRGRRRHGGLVLLLRDLRAADPPQRRVQHRHVGLLFRVPVRELDVLPARSAAEGASGSPRSRTRSRGRSTCCATRRSGWESRESWRLKPRRSWCSRSRRLCMRSDRSRMRGSSIPDHDEHTSRIPNTVQTKRPDDFSSGLSFVINAGSDLLSHTVSHAVPSAVSGLTSVFGMGTGVTLIL